MTQQRTTERQTSLILHCVARPDDILIVETFSGPSPLPGPMQSQVRLTTEDMTEGEGTSVMLDRDRARELFNWLGVWLHTA